MSFEQSTLRCLQQPLHDGPLRALTNDDVRNIYPREIWGSRHLPVKTAGGAIQLFPVADSYVAQSTNLSGLRGLLDPANDPSCGGVGPARQVWH